MSTNFTPVPCNIPVEQGHCYRVGDYFITGQPTDPDGFSVAKQKGVQSVICLRDSSEQGFDLNEGLAWTTMEIGYANLPLPHTIDQAAFDRQINAGLWLLNQQMKPLLMHCSSGDRASSLWAAHLIVDYGLPVEQAIALAEQTGLSNPAFIQLVTNYCP